MSPPRGSSLCGGTRAVRSRPLARAPIFVGGSAILNGGGGGREAVHGPVLPAVGHGSKSNHQELDPRNFGFPFTRAPHFGVTLFLTHCHLPFGFQTCRLWPVGVLQWSPHGTYKQHLEGIAHGK